MPQARPTDHLRRGGGVLQFVRGAPAADGGALRVAREESEQLERQQRGEERERVQRRDGGADLAEARGDGAGDSVGDGVWNAESRWLRVAPSSATSWEPSRYLFCFSKWG